ncbi:unnamed protein product [Prunus armeniaca]
MVLVSGIAAFEQVVPNSEHRFYARYLFTNFILLFKGKSLSDKFWGATKATTVPQFARQMEKLKNLDKDAYAWLTKTSQALVSITLQHSCEV